MGASLVLALLLGAAPAAAGPRLTPAAEKQLTEGIDRLYGLDYDASRAAFRKLIELEPDNPWGYLFEAGGIWWQSSQEYGLFKDTPTLQGLFEQDVEAALRKAEAYIDSKDPQTRADGYFVSGMTLGTRGQWNVMKGKWIAAYLDGKKAVKHLNKCVKLDDEYYDAYLGLGLFDYQAARFSGIARLGAFLGGMRGDEKRGLERIALATEKARYANRQAAQLLANTYIIDLHDYARALPVLEKLRVMFPDSVYFVFLEALVRHRLGDWDGSAALGRTLFTAAPTPRGSAARSSPSSAACRATPASPAPTPREPWPGPSTPWTRPPRRSPARITPGCASCAPIAWTCSAGARTRSRTTRRSSSSPTSTAPATAPAPAWPSPADGPCC